ncbi:MAG: STAS domain-containing protein [Bacilli bacterium]|nr:STAS domain-containing protein [Bacilli bacterium]
MLKMDLEYSRGILFVRLDGKLNRTTTYKINNYLVPVLLKHKIKYLVYNLYNLHDIDEEGIDAILNTKYAIKTNKGLIYLCEVNKSLSKKIHKLHIKKTETELSAFKVIEV